MSTTGGTHLGAGFSVVNKTDKVPAVNGAFKNFVLRKWMLAHILFYASSVPLTNTFGHLSKLFL